MMVKNLKDIKFLVFYLIYLCLVVATSRFPFFWDTIQLASKHATYFYDTNFSSIILPQEMDSGHFPLLGLYMAFIWKFAGRSLFASHLAMIPFVMGIIWQVQQLTRRLFSKKWQFLAMAVILADATLLAQSTLVSPDILLVFFFLVALNSLLAGKRTLLILSLTGLTLTSMRGMLCVAGFFVAQTIIQIFLKRKDPVSGSVSNIRRIRALISDYFPAVIIAVFFFAWHYYRTGWMGFHKDMPWSSLFEISDPATAARNILIIGWRLADFGRLFILVTGVLFLLHYLKHRPKIPKDVVIVTIVLLPIFFFLVLPGIVFTGLTGHRYFMPLFILISLLVVWYLFEIFTSDIFKKTIFFILVAGLLTGNLWIYPDKISKGWDSTLAYLPYFPLRDRMLDYMKKENIPIDQTGTLFPNLGRFDYLDLSGRDTSFAELDMEANRYIFYSNIFNGFSDHELDELNHHWIPVKTLRCSQVKVILYHKPYGYKYIPIMNE